ncbi:MAG: MOSC domain-containing protein [Solirubrobacterales bacterium]|nr:MOSC domain-containing protein [Solirubrobacterales bacterium]
MNGRVVSLHRWPVKSFGGEEVAALELDARGAAGDRAHALFDEFKDSPRRLTIRQVSRMVLWSAAYGDDPVALDDPPAPAVTSPAGENFSWDDRALRAALEADLGRPVTLRRDPALMQDLPDSLLVTFGASHRLVEEALGPLDPLRWRTNIHVEADAPPFAEVGWEGAVLEVGEAQLQLLHPCERCVIPTRDPNTAEKRPEILRHLHSAHATLFGINARPLGHARIAVGDPVGLRA